ncbi:hypothetical protein [Caminibacter sp.]
MTMQIDIKKVFRFDREISKLLGELEIFKNFISEIDISKLSKEDIKEIIDLARHLWSLKDEISNKEIKAKIKELIKIIATKIENGSNEEEKILSLIGDMSYLDYLEAKENGELIVFDDIGEFAKAIDEL